MTIQSAPEAADDDRQPPVPAAPPAALSEARPRGRAVRLPAIAVLVGLVGGAGTGYVIQYLRPPTVRPLLASQASQPPQPNDRHIVPARLTAAEDDQVKTDGDLRTLLVPAPAGSRPWPNPPTQDGWLTLAQFSSTFESPATEFRWQNSLGFRRMAQATWVVGDTGYEVDLIQYAHAEEGSAAEYVQDQDFNGPVPEGVTRSVVPGTVNGWVKQDDNPQHAGDGSTYFSTEAMARHGDIAVQIYVTGPRPTDSRIASDLMQRQLERL